MPITATRRTVLSSLAGAATGRIVGAANEPPRIEVSVVPTQQALADAPAWAINEVARLLEVALREPLPEEHLEIGPVSVASVGDNVPDDAKSAADWWRSRASTGYDDCELLICSRAQTDWEHAGYARFDGEVAVATGAEEYPDRDWMTIALHEVGHSLGLRHHHAGTVEGPTGRGRSIMATTYDGHRVHRFSEEAQAELRAQY